MSDDLISRQEAIDALLLGKELLNRVLDDVDVVGIDREKYSWGLGLIEAYIYDIEELPPAQLGIKKGKQTNADRIRSMSDEELAVWIVHKTEGNGFDGYEEHVKSWLDWLREEVCDANNSTD